MTSSESLARKDAPAAWAAAVPYLPRILQWASWVLLLTYVAGRFYGLPFGMLVDWDESLYAWRAKIAAVEGDWLDQSAYTYGPRGDEPGAGFYSGAFPPLLVWQMGAMFELFGFEEWAARFPTAVVSALALVAMYIIGRLLGGHLVGFLAAAFMGSIDYILRFSRMAQFDMPYTSWMLIFVAFYLLRMRYPERRRTFLVLAGLSMGAGLMTKIAFPAFAAINVFLWQAALLLFAWRHGDARWLNPLEPREFQTEAARPPLGCAALRYLVDHLAIVAVALVVWAPWHLYMTWKHGLLFWDWYIGYHLIRRSQAPIDWHEGAWYFYPFSTWDRLPAFLYAMALVGLVWGTIHVVGRLVRKESPAAEGPAAGPPRLKTAGLLFTLLWIGILATLLQSSVTKREIYLIPVYTMLALLGALYFAEWVRRPPRFAFHQFAALAVTIFCIVSDRTSDPRLSYAWSAITGEYQLEPGDPTVLEAIGGYLGIVLGLAAGILIVPWAIALVRAKWRPRAAAIRTGVAAAAIVVCVGVYAVREVRAQFEHQRDPEWPIFVEMREWIDDAERWPHVAALLKAEHGSPRPSRMYYFYGVIDAAEPIPRRYVERHDYVQPGMFDSVRRPGGLVIVEWGIERGDPELWRILQEELRGFRRVVGDDESLFRLYVYDESGEAGKPDAGEGKAGTE